jgi:phospholipid/cholesterol/gamma-HCH transport system permease protein
LDCASVVTHRLRGMPNDVISTFKNVCPRPSIDLGEGAIVWPAMCTSTLLHTASTNADDDLASVQCRTDLDGHDRVTLYGRWDIRAIRNCARGLLQRLRAAAKHETCWDLTQIKDIDAAGATLIWYAWNRSRPNQLSVRTEDAAVFDSLAAIPSATAAAHSTAELPPIARFGRLGLKAWRSNVETLALLGAAAIDTAAMLHSLADIPRREITATIFRTGAQAVAISGLVGFLIGIVLCYLSGEQLRDLGAESYVVNLTGYAIFRELGPLLAAILNAGRSGSAMTAQIGVMRVTEELDAMSVLGISHVRRLVVPKLIGQLVALPLVVAWTDLTAIVGAMAGARLQLGIGPVDFLRGIVRVVPLANVLFGVGKGALFGGTVALISCHFGFRIRPDSESLAAGTTQSVVTSLTAVLIIDAALAILFSDLGM